MTIELDAEFWKRVDKTGTCWLWTGRTQKGYGYVLMGNRQQRVHRVVYAALTGLIPRGLCVRHTCDIPNCVNPLHLVLGSHQDNVRDRVERGRSAMGHRNGAHTLPARRPVGERHGRRRHPEAFARGSQTKTAKLTEANVRDIRLRYAAGETTYALAAAFGVSRPAIGYVINRKTWAHV